MSPDTRLETWQKGEFYEPGAFARCSVTLGKDRLEPGTFREVIANFWVKTSDDREPIISLLSDPATSDEATWKGYHAQATGTPDDPSFKLEGAADLYVEFQYGEGFWHGFYTYDLMHCTVELLTDIHQPLYVYAGSSPETLEYVYSINLDYMAGVQVLEEFLLTDEEPCTVAFYLPKDPNDPDLVRGLTLSGFELYDSTFTIKDN